eukprot:gene8764-10367_t
MSERKRSNEGSCEDSQVSTFVDEYTMPVSPIECSKKAKTFEEHPLNTNVSIKNSLGWKINRCIRELLLNCTDEDPDAVVEKVDDRTWKLVNKMKDGRESLQKHNFSYHSNDEKLEDRLKNGKYGYGLKDAVVLLTAHGIQYVARSINGSFTAHQDHRGDIWVRINPNDGIPDCVEQVISIGSESQLTPEDFEREIEFAQRQCIAFRVRSIYRHYESIKIHDKSSNAFGTVYLSPEGQQDGCAELFVHGCAYPFCEESDRKPLALIYDLHMDKTTIKGRDRTGLPDKWEPALRNLLKVAKASVLHRLWTLQKAGKKFYEFTNHHLCEHINKYSKEIHKANQKLVADARRAQEDADRAAALRDEKNKELVQASLVMSCPDADDSEPLAVLLMRKDTFVQLQEEKNRAELHAEQEQARAVVKAELAKTATLNVAPTALMFPYDSQSGMNVNPIRIKNTKHPDWITGDVPWIEELRLMEARNPPIDSKHTRLFRQLRRLLYAVGLENKVIIDQADFSMPVTTLVMLRGTTMHVRFGALEINVLHAAILELSSAGLFSGLMGRTRVDALTRLSILLLQLTPEEPQEIVNCRSNLISQYLGELQSSATVNSFCPLLVATEWDTKRGGISSFNIQLAKGLAVVLRQRQAASDNAQPVLYVMVLTSDEIDDATQAQWDAAAELGIQIIEGSRLRGKYTPCLSVSECSRITHIVGHAHITGNEAAQMRKLPQLQHALLWQINHVLPLEADILKEDGTAQSRYESAHKKESTLKDLNEKADHVFSVGKMMYQHFEKQLDKVGRVGGTKHTQLILPLNPDFLSNPTSKQDFGEEIEVLYFGRTDSGVFFLKGMDIAMRAVEKANADEQIKSSGRQIVLKVRGTKPGMEAETVRKLIALQNEHNRDITPYVVGFASPAEILADLQQTHMVIMPSRNEPFGLVAMEAIACQVPLLVSNNSGVAHLLKKHDLEKLCVLTSVHHPNDASASASQADVNSWSLAILKLIAQGQSAFERAKTLATTLRCLSDPCPYTAMIELGDGGASASSNPA